jgi:hypothetical protein
MLSIIIFLKINKRAKFLFLVSMDFTGDLKICCFNLLNLKNNYFNYFSIINVPCMFFSIEYMVDFLFEKISFWSFGLG